MLRKANSITEFFFLSLTLFLILSFPPPSFANHIDNNAGSKLLRGVVNISTGWIEIFQGIYVIGVEKGLVTGVLYGPIFGVGMAMARTGSGLYETVTFPLPFPARYRPTLQPEFIWLNWSFFGGLGQFAAHQGTEEAP